MERPLDYDLHEVDISYITYETDKTLKTNCLKAGGKLLRRTAAAELIISISLVVSCHTLLTNIEILLSITNKVQIGPDAPVI